MFFDSSRILNIVTVISWIAERIYEGLKGNLAESSFEKLFYRSRPAYNYLYSIHPLNFSRKFIVEFHINYLIFSRARIMLK
jgi:hypothetical protein